MTSATAELLMEGLGLMAIGMTIVFAFLLLLVGMLFAMSALAARIEGRGQMPLPTAVSPASEAADPRVVAAVAAAVGLYRRHRRAARPSST